QKGPIVVQNCLTRHSFLLIYADVAHCWLRQSPTRRSSDLSTSWNKVEVDQPHRHHPQIVKPQLEGLLHFRSGPPARVHTRAPAGQPQSSGRTRSSVPL